MRYFIVAFLLLCVPVSAHARQWTSSTGKFTLEGDFVELTEDDRVRIRQTDGKTFVIPLSKLSEADRKHVQMLTASPKDSPFSAESLSAAGKAKPTELQTTQTVVVEGVGLTADAALEDAYRQAVRQVMGTVVDAVTLIKNDELIEDKVLTYSDGFITRYDKLSERRADGLTRVRITAVVERRSLIEKLSAANVSMKQLDGKNLFAELKTQLDAEASTAALLRRALDGFPLNCLTVGVEGKPEILSKDEEKAKLRFLVRYEADLAAYDAFAKRITQMLDEVALRKGEFSLEGRKIARDDNIKPGYAFDHRGESYYDGSSLWPIKIPPYKDMAQYQSLPSDRGEFVIAVNVQRTNTFDRSDWKYFVLDRAVKSIVASSTAVVPYTRLTLVDSTDQDIVVTRFPAMAVYGSQWLFNAWLVSSSGVFAFQSQYRGPYSLGSKPKSGWYPDYAKATVGELRESVDSRIYTGERLFLFSPMFFGGSSNSRKYLSSLHVKHDLELTLDELKRIQNVRCELKHDGRLPPEFPQK
jgi:hypothetical protein